MLLCEMTLTIPWWGIPTAITLLVFVGFIRAFFFFSEDRYRGGGFSPDFSTLISLLFLIPWLIVSTIAWAIAAFLK